MPTERDSNGTVDPVLRPFAKFWEKYFEQANGATRELLENVDGTKAKVWQRQWLDAISKSMDAYMRSEPFLRAMKQNADMMIATKTHSDDLATEFARNANIPTATDISGLFERLHGIENVILDRLGRIEERITTIEERIGTRETVGRA